MATFTPTASPADIAAVQDVLKEVWVTDTLESQLYEDTIILDWVEDITDYTDSDGLKASVPLRTGRTAGISARAVGQALGVAGHQVVDKASYNYTNQYLQVKINGPVVARMKTNRQSCVREIDFEVKNGLADLKRDWVRQLYGDGSAVIAGSLPGGASSTTVLLGADNYYAIERGFLHVGMPVDIGTAANPTLDTGGNVITDIVDSPTAPAIVVTSATATTAGSGVSRYGNRTSGSVSNELNGFANLFDDDTTLGDINPASAAHWKGVKVGNSGTPRPLSIDLAMTLIRRLRQKGSYPDTAVCDLYQEQQYYNLLQPQVRFAGEGALKAGNTDGLQLAKIKKGLVGDPDCNPGKIYAFSKDALMMFSAGPVAWQNQTTGGDILAWEQGYDAFVARAAKYFQIGTDRRCSLGTLEDLESDPYS